MYLPWIQWVTEPGLAPTMTLPAENQGLRIIDDPTEISKGLLLYDFL